MSSPADQLAIGELLDRFVTEQIRCWMLNDAMVAAPDDATRGRLAATMLRANARRVALRGAITDRLEGAGNRDDVRTYGSVTGEGA